MLDPSKEERDESTYYPLPVTQESSSSCDPSVSPKEEQPLPLHDAVSLQRSHLPAPRVSSDSQIPVYTGSSQIASPDSSATPASAKPIRDRSSNQNHKSFAPKSAHNPNTLPDPPLDVLGQSVHKSGDSPNSQLIPNYAATLSPANKNRRKLQDFEFGSFLGDGALGRVYHARHSVTGNEVAIKVVQKSRIANETLRIRLFTERSIWKDLNHPSIIRLQCTFQDDAALYFVQELGGLTNLSEKLVRWGGTLPYDIAKFYTAEIVGMIWYLRSKSVAHRDLKPHNLLVNKDGHLKLIDFNSAIVLPISSTSSSSHANLPSSSHKDRNFVNTSPCVNEDTIQLVGTMAYAPPELFDLREDVGFAADLWALGCITYQFFAGQSPFADDSEKTMRERISNVDYHFPKGFPPPIEDFVQKLLLFDPEKRLGATDLNELTGHPFLKDVNISQIHKCTLPMDLYETEQFAVNDPDLAKTLAKNELEDLEFTPNIGESFSSGKRRMRNLY
ncbi:putative serine/threonine-protein kinase pdkA [Cardiosporidium cionae]|uniref:non-specific serine/threonine protein kinase n=1 Tax=Cardiosporidium cionae TaxID=476202 RepID=A0ABQ7J8M4_9APIC|nr:putative serine/threonine-protein kinase pdkA [Cardiosporidium cionae]|eukprot:KAF8820337.1 putative serine/threonine-protein kinase pdkA [Cardiosporidium cionae]